MLVRGNAHLTLTHRKDSLKLVIDSLDTLDMVSVRTRPIEGYKAAVMPYDFAVMVGDADNPVDAIEGSAGEVLIVSPVGRVSVLTAAEYAAGFAKVMPRKVTIADAGNDATVPPGEAF